MRGIIFGLALTLLASLSVPAQSYQWEGGLFLGIGNVTGDLVATQLPPVKETHPAFGLWVRRSLSPSIALRTNLIYGHISADDRNFSEPEWRQRRAFSFSSSITELSLQLEWEIFGFRRFDDRGYFNSIFSPYVFAGGGIVIFDPKTDFSQNIIKELFDASDADAVASYSNIQPTIPMGLGFRIDLSQRTVLSIEGGVRTAFTDYLDGVSLAGDPANNDWYGFGGASIAYRFGEEDSDGDAIADSKDACPEIAGSKRHRGCPDSDGDGLVDSRDQCPDELGLASNGGCPDRDLDGIADIYDRCPDEFGFPKRNGCPIYDTDGDGIEDEKDECPQTAGIAELNGCPFLDADDDGILDEEDHCPNVPGMEIFDGCPDTDHDGIEDPKDECPEEFGIFDNNGCPWRDTPEDKARELSTYDLLFEEGRSDIQRYYTVDQILAFLKENPDFNVYIKGHTGEEGDPEQNQALSLKRAKSCYDYFLENGIDPARMSYEGFGNQMPVTLNTSEAGRSLNRRVEFEIFPSVN